MVIKDFSYMYPLFPIIGTLALLACLYPVPAHWQSGNIATVSLALWTSVGLFICIINVCVWHGNINNPYPVWGDITAGYFAICAPAIASSALCLQYRLWSVARAKTVFVTKREKRMQRLTTCFMCFGIPVILLITHYLVQGHRFDIYQDLGPTTDTYNVTLAYPLYFIWETILCFTSGVFGILTIRLLLQRRKLFEEVLNSGSTRLNKDNYIRLLLLAAWSFCVHFPLTLWVLIINLAEFHVQPWISWADTKYDFHRVDYYTRFLVTTLPTSWVTIRSVAWWSLPLCGFSFFAFFGFGSASQPYQPLIKACLKPFGIKYPMERKKKRSAARRTWLDFILCRPSRPSTSQGSLPTSSVPRFTTSGSHPSNRTEITTVAGVDSVIDVAQFNFLSFGNTATQVSDMSAEEKQYKQDAETLSPPTAMKVTFDVEAQTPDVDSAAQQRRREILEKNPELTEEVTF